jgi:L-rhamnose mutarotase
MGGVTRRVCFQVQVKPDRLDEYVARHSPVRPEMLEAIAVAGRRNYSLFLRPDGLLIGYFETDDLEASRAALAANPVTAVWEAEMAEFFEAADFASPESRVDQELSVIPEVFNLEDQLAEARG